MRITHLQQPTPDGEPAPAWRRRKEHRSAEIMSAARHLFEAQGYEKTSLMEIAQAAGVSEATVYKYFDGKLQLVHLVIEGWMSPMLDQLEQDLKVAPSGLDKLIILVRNHLHAMVTYPKMHELIYRELRWHRYRGSRLHRLNKRYSKIVLSTLDMAAKRGEIRTVSESSLQQDILFGAMEHAGLRIAFGNATSSVDSVARQLVAQIFGLPPQSLEKLDSKLVDRLEEAVDKLSSLARI